MKKIMFNDRYGLTQAVLEGKKTMYNYIKGIRRYERINKDEKKVSVMWELSGGQF